MAVSKDKSLFCPRHSFGRRGTGNELAHLQGDVLQVDSISFVHFQPKAQALPDYLTQDFVDL